MIKEIFPYCKDPTGWEQVFNDLLPKHGIDTPQRKACFLAQCGHESSSFNILSENMNYSVDGLLKVFPRHFKDRWEADKVAFQPSKIGNIVYSNRMGNGPDEGYKFRGRGILQVTGKDNYRECSKYLFNDERLLENPDLLVDKNHACMSAIWFWNRNHLNTYADAKDFLNLTKRINGGTNGLRDRENYYKKAIEILC